MFTMFHNLPNPNFMILLLFLQKRSMDMHQHYPCQKITAGGRQQNRENLREAGTISSDMLDSISFMANCQESAISCFCDLVENMGRSAIKIIIFIVRFVEISIEMLGSTVGYSCLVGILAVSMRFGHVNI